jgi:hypothetical protein
MIIQNEKPSQSRFDKDLLFRVARYSFKLGVRTALQEKRICPAVDGCQRSESEREGGRPALSSTRPTGKSPERRKTSPELRDLAISIALCYTFETLNKKNDH